MARCAMNTLNMHVFTSATEASVRLAAFRHHYNEEHPHSELDDQTPSEFKRAWIAAQHKDETTLQFQRSAMAANGVELILVRMRFQPTNRRLMSCSAFIKSLAQNLY